MVILHLLSQTYLTGSEVYVAQLCKQQMADGHRCIIATEKLTVPTAAEHVVVPLHITKGHTRSLNVAKLIGICTQEKVDVLHAHSRASCKYANKIHRTLGIAYVSTIHGPQTAHFKNRYFNVFGNTKIVVCEALRDNMITTLKHSVGSIRVVRNGI